MVTPPEGVQVIERIEGPVLLDVEVEARTAPGVRVVTAELRDGERHCLVTLGLEVIAGAGTPTPLPPQLTHAPSRVGEAFASFLLS